ncbi:MAG: hypothetical protein AAFR76_15750, partial [Planctomycetota bacterium]
PSTNAGVVKGNAVDGYETALRIGADDVRDTGLLVEDNTFAGFVADPEPPIPGVLYRRNQQRAQWKGLRLESYANGSVDALLAELRESRRGNWSDLRPAAIVKWFREQYGVEG